MREIRWQRLLGGGLVFSALTYALMVGAWRAGYFFDESYVPVATWLCLSAILAIGWQARAVLQMGERGAGLYAEEVATRKQTEAIVLWPLLIALLYVWQPLWIGEMPLSAALEQGARWGGYAGFLLLALRLAGSGHRWAATALALPLHLACGLLLWSGVAGWLGWLGWLDDPRLVLTSVDPRLSGIGARAAGLLQYPNLYGAVLAAYLSWHWRAMLRPDRPMLWLGSVVLAIPTGAMLLLTESRGAWLVALAIWGVGLCSAGRSARAVWLLYPAAALTGSAALYSALLAQRLGQQADGWGLAACLAMLCGGVALVCALRGAWGALEGMSPTRRAQAAAAISLLLAGAAIWLLPDAASARLEPGSYSTAGARWQLYRDAWRQIAEAPWLGHGADAWRRHVGQLQRMPYVSMEVHSGYLNQLLELGAVGLTLLAGLLAQLLHRVWQAQRLATLPLLALLLHAAIDFDMSYGLYWLLLFGFAAQGIGGRNRAAQGIAGRDRAAQDIVAEGRGSAAQGEGSVRKGQGGAAQVEGSVGQCRGVAMQSQGGVWEGQVQAVQVEGGVRKGWGGAVQGRDSVEGGARQGRDSVVQRLDIAMKGQGSATQGPGSVQSQGSATQDPGSVQSRGGAVQARGGTAVGSRRSRGRAPRWQWPRALSALLTLALLAVAAASGLHADAALTARQQALAATGKARLAALREGLAAHPHDTRMRLELATLAPLQERAALLAAGLRHDPQSWPLVWALGAAHAERGETQQAAAYLRRALRLDRYDKAKQSAAVQWLAWLAAEHREAGRLEEAQAAAAAGAEVYARYRLLARLVELRGAAGEGRRFVLLPEATEAADYCRKLLRGEGVG